MHDDWVRLQHMLEAAQDALAFSQGRTRQDLETDRMLAFALIRCIEIIGEAASRLSAEIREQYPEIPWGDIIGMRNRLIHAYYDINLDILWKTIQDDLPPLIEQLRAIIATEGGEDLHPESNN